MAVVYLARDRQLDRDVAIKVLNATLSEDPISAARLAHEARLVAQLEHPNIVAIYDLESLRDKSVALIMQYVRGRTLRRVIDEDGRLPFPFVERVLAEIASALAVAHRRGIIHRDVKPENIYLEEESGRALLADFGIAHAPRLKTGLTIAGEALGTPHYMSPEQISGLELDGRSDLYSLGLVGYEMLTGERPWHGETLYSVLHKQQHEYLTPLRYRHVLAPDSLEQALEQVLSKNRTHRPASAEAFLAMLGAGRVTTADEGSGESNQAGEFSPDAPTVRYQKGGTQAGEGPRNAEGREAAAPIPLWMRPEEPPPAPAPEAARSLRLRALGAVKAGVTVVSQRIHPEEEKGGLRAAEPNRLRSALGIVAAAASMAFLVVLIGLFATPEAFNLGVAATPPDTAAVLPVIAEEEPASPQNSGNSRAARAPAGSRTGGGGGGNAADLRRRFCRLLPNETVEEWAARVPSYCSLPGT
jgi:hypothetical protein